MVSTVRSAWGTTVRVEETRLLDRSGSRWLLESVKVMVLVPPIDATSETERAALPLEGTVPRSQRTVPSTCAHDPWLEVKEARLIPAGSSERMTAVEAAGPRFVTESEKTVGTPARAVVAGGVWERPSSASGSLVISVNTQPSAMKPSVLFTVALSGWSSTT